MHSIYILLFSLLGWEGTAKTINNAFFIIVKVCWKTTKSYGRLVPQGFVISNGCV